ncbi:MAG: hypothetical protein J7L45_00045 [Candidatus Aenigmarchaeota archaeon]|nr:hypothetical protein [Candidatus Aenigmarchaeota archaeon]
MILYTVDEDENIPEPGKCPKCGSDLDYDIEKIEFNRLDETLCIPQMQEMWLRRKRMLHFFSP